MAKKKSQSKVQPQSKSTNLNTKHNRNISKKLLNVYEIDEDQKATHQRLHNLDDIEKNKYEVDNIESEDDEEIDSDDAYGEPDEVTASTSVRKFKKNKKKKPDSEDESEEDLQEGFVDLSEMLKDEKSSTEQTGKKDSTCSSKVSFKDLLTIEDNEPSSDEDELFDQSDEEEAEGTSLVDFVSKLDQKNKKVQKYLTEKNETYKESEFNLTSTDNTNNKLSLSDLMAPLQDEAGFAHITKKVQQFSGDKKKLEPTKAPLAKRLQDRINRSIAYEDAVERVSEWKPVIDQNRQADHLNFVKVIKDSSTCASLINESQLVTDLEKEVQSVLSTSKLAEKDIQKTEELELIKVSPEEIKARQKALMQMRELMFRNEAKAKRVKKIKSKAYHRLKKKEKLKSAELEQAFGSESDEDQFDAEAARARERMTLKHKNTGKWAKSLLKHGSRHTENQTAIMAQINEHERLKNKITGDASDRETDSDFDLDEHDPQKHAISEIEKLVANPSQVSSKGLMGMKFMQKAIHAQNQELERLAAEAKEDIETLNHDDDVSTLEAKVSTKVQGNDGRLTFSGASTTDAPYSELDSNVNLLKNYAVSNETAHTHTHTTKLTGPITVSSQKANSDNATAASNTSDNPWLLQEDATSVKRKRNKTGDSNTDKANKTVSKIKKVQHNLDSKNTLQPEVDVNTTLLKKPDSDAELESSEVEVKDELADLVPVDNPNAFSQKDLVRLAFAGDDVTQEFYDEKAMVVEEDAPKVEDLTLPGWGSWGGASIKAKPLSNATKIKRNLLRITKGVSVEKRKDLLLNHVIINEKRNKKLEKYTPTRLPPGFASKTQYELNLATPLGQEWSPATTHYKSTKPRILTKKGQIIDPLYMKDH